MPGTLYTIKEGTAPNGQQHPQHIMTFAESVIALSSGVVDKAAGHLAVSQLVSPTMKVRIATGLSLLVDPSGYPTYPIAHLLDYTEVDVVANSSGQPRIDTVVQYYDKAQNTNTNSTNVAKFLVVQGTPGASPSAPNDATIQAAVSAGNPWHRLANLAVASGATQILTANITDVRTQAVYRYAGVDLFAGTTTGASNVYTATIPSVTAYADNMVVSFTAHQDNGGAATFGIGALPTKALVTQNGNVLTADQILTGDVVTVRIVGSNAYIVSSSRYAGGKRTLNVASVTGTYDLDARLYDAAEVQIAGTSTIRINYLKRSKQVFLLYVRQDGTGGRDYTIHLRRSDGAYATTPPTSFGMGLLKATAAWRYDVYAICSPNEYDFQVGQVGSDFQ